jgi:hypothetical protein
LLPSSRTLATLALFWESIELPTHESTSDPDEEELHVIRALVDEGIVNLRDVSRVSDEAIYDAEGREVAAVWEQTTPGTTIETIHVAFAEEIIRARARRVARLIEARARSDSSRRRFPSLMWSCLSPRRHSFISRSVVR